MKGLKQQTKALAACGIAASFFAASTLAYAQDVNAPADPSAPQQQQQHQQQTNPPAPNAPPPQSAPSQTEGWPQAGAAPDANAPQPSAPPASGSAPAANPYGQPPAAPPQASGPYAGQQQAYPPQSYPPQSYPQQPYGQPAYGQQPYGAQQQPYGPQQPYGGGVYSQAPAPPPIPAEIQIPAGTYVTARLNTRLASDRNHAGDAFTATLVDPVVVNGVVVAEPGQTITGQVVEAQKVDGTGRLVVQLTDLPIVDGQRIPIQTQLISRKGDRFRGNDAGVVAGSTAAGAVIGGAIGWGTGAAIGAGMGALISLGAVMTHGHASVLYPEEVLTFQIQQPINVSTTGAPQAFRYVQPGEYDAPRGAPGPYMQANAVAANPPAYYAYPGYAYSPWFWGPSVGFYFGGPGFYRGGYWGGRPFYRGGFRR